MYVTMMDPFQIKYGNLLSGALVLPSIMMDVLWVASTLLSLGEHAFCWSLNVPAWKQTICVLQA